MKIICFHKPSEENGYLSNWYPAEFIYCETPFSSTEQFMMYEKAKLFGDDEMMAVILKEHSPAKIKGLGRKIKNFNEELWKENRYNIVYVGNLAKFSQNQELKDMLLATGDAILAECAIKDKIWGIGISMTSSKRFDPEQWKGDNLLGKALMEVREALKLCSAG